MFNFNDGDLNFYLVNSSHICGICQRFDFKKSHIIVQAGRSVLVCDGEDYERCGILNTIGEGEERRIRINGFFCPKLEKYMIDQGEGTWNYEEVWRDLTEIPYPGPIPSIWRLVFGLWLVSEWNTQTGDIDLDRLMDAIEEGGFEGGRVTRYFGVSIEEWRLEEALGEEGEDRAFLINGNANGELLPQEDRPFLDDCTHADSLGTPDDSRFF